MFIPLSWLSLNMNDKELIYMIIDTGQFDGEKFGTHCMYLSLPEIDE